MGRMEAVMARLGNGLTGDDLCGMATDINRRAAAGSPVAVLGLCCGRVLSARVRGGRLLVTLELENDADGGDDRLAPVGG